MKVKKTTGVRCKPAAVENVSHLIFPLNISVLVLLTSSHQTCLFGIIKLFERTKWIMFSFI